MQTNKSTGNVQWNKSCEEAVKMKKIKYQKLGY